MALETDTNSSEPKFQVFLATYNSPTNDPFTHAHQISTPPTSKTTDRTSYLASLRVATAEAQAVINRELTARMEDDKAREVSAVDGKKVVDDAKEADNYGEEVVEEN